MTVTLGIAWALFVLAPGLAVYAALYTTALSEVVPAAPPAPNSFTSLAVVIFGALASHTFAAVLLAANDIWAASNAPSIGVPFDPNVYGYFLSRSPQNVDAGREAAALLLVFSALCTSAFLFTRHAVIRATPNGWLHRFLFGPWAQLVAQMRPEVGFLKHLAAYAVTDMETEISDPTQCRKVWVGYEGEVESFTLNSEKQITSLTLRNSKAFLLGVNGQRVDHDVVTRESAIPRLILEQSRTKNLALSPVFEPEEAPKIESALTRWLLRQP